MGGVVGTLSLLNYVTDKLISLFFCFGSFVAGRFLISEVNWFFFLSFVWLREAYSLGPSL